MSAAANIGIVTVIGHNDHDIVRGQDGDDLGDLFVWPVPRPLRVLGTVLGMSGQIGF